jgi:cytochrome c553
VKDKSQETKPLAAKKDSGPAKPADEQVSGKALIDNQKVPGATASGLAASCLSCHGAHGEGNLAGGIPALAGLPALYIVDQLADYASGVRVNPVMAPIAKGLSDADRRSLAQYFTGLEQSKVKNKTAEKKSALFTRGEILASRGDAKMQLQACSNCHGPGGTMHSLMIPPLAGQSASYIKTQLLAWKSGDRKNSPNQMIPVTQRLDDKSIDALSEYFQHVKTN